jgi:hypothetical protein
MSFACLASAPRMAGSQLGAGAGLAVSERAADFRLAAARGADTFFFGVALSADSVGVFRGRGSVGFLLLVSYYKIAVPVPIFFRDAAILRTCFACARFQRFRLQSR